MKIKVQGILLQACAIDQAIEIGAISAQALRPLRGYAANVVHKERIVEPPKDSPLLKRPRVSLLQEIDQKVSDRPCGLGALGVSEASNDEVGMDRDIQDSRRPAVMRWKSLHPLVNVFA